jgi:hypothetical protein
MEWRGGGGRGRPPAAPLPPSQRLGATRGERACSPPGRLGSPHSLWRAGAALPHRELGALESAWGFVDALWERLRPHAACKAAGQV